MNKKPVQKKKNAPKKKVVAKTTKQAAAKSTSKVVKSTPKVAKVAHKVKTFNKKNKLIVGVVSLVVLILLVLFLTIKVNTPDEIIDPVSDNNTTEPFLDVTVPETLTEEELQEKAMDLQLRITKEIMNTQKQVFEGWYPELGLDKTQMEQCYAENDFTNQDLNFENATILLKLMEDQQMAQAIGISGTPGIFINSYKVGGYVPYDNIATLIEMAGEDELPDLDFNNNSYVADTNGPAKLILISNQEYSLTQKVAEEYIVGLKEGPYAEFFTQVFSEVEIENIDYREDKAKELMETLNAPILPLFFFEGDINSTEFSKNELFTQAFQPMAGGYLLYLPEHQNFNYVHLKSENDYIIGDESAVVNVYIFTDYDCPYCTQLDNEVLDKLKEEYIDTRFANLVIKDYITNQNTSLMPAIFSRCAQEQDAYYEAHRKLFESTDKFGSLAIEPLYSKYDSEIQELENAYKELYPQE